jgi:DNA-binding GntR family transcriptional regulator
MHAILVAVSTYGRLRELIVSGELALDGAVPESQLAQRLGVSRTPVREALQRLEGDGVVIARGRGIRLRVLTIDQLADVLTARAGLEGWALELAARRWAAGEIPPARIDALRVHARDADAYGRAGDLARAAQSNRSFHTACAALAQSPSLDEALARWWDQITVSTRQTIQRPRRVDAVDQEHGDILAALTAGDGAAARAAVIQHVLATREELLDRSLHNS